MLQNKILIITLFILGSQLVLAQNKDKNNKINKDVKVVKEYTPSLQCF